jgi:DNA polymerase/3'-5' exonuclease PolX
MNQVIVDEFTKLIAFIEYKINEFKENNNKKEVNVNNFRLRQLKNVLKILKNYPEKISINNYKELINMDGIGKGTIERVKEILETTQLSELKDFNEIYKNSDFKNENKVISELMEIIGVGPVKAKDLFNEGVKGVQDLKKKIKSNKIEVNEKIMLGIKYHGVYQVNIPRKEIDKIYKVVTKMINRINEEYNLNEKNKYIFEICGSYRREKPTSNDIDILLTKLGDSENNKNHLKMFVNKMKKKKLLVDDITDKNIETKYMGFIKYKDNPVRRIDIRYVDYEYYCYALLYFTGSSDLNKKMREIAKSKGLKLSEYGLFDSKNNNFKVKSERDIFKKLGLEYLPPRLR